MIKSFSANNFESLAEEKKYQYRINSKGELRFLHYCPICGEFHKSNPDFSINCISGLYSCQRKEKGGTVEELKRYGFDISKVPELRKFLGMSPKEIYELNNSSKNYKEVFEKPVETDMTNLFKNRINGDTPFMWIEYLAKRGIREKTFEGIVNFDKYNNMIIPINNGEKIVGIKYRSIDKKLRSEKESSSAYFMNWQNIKKFDYIIIVEGEIDLLSGLEVGANIVSLSFGAGNIKCVVNQKEWLSKFKNIIIATDNDEQGKKSKAKIVGELKDLKSNLLEVDLGEYKDFNEVLISENGRKKLINIIKNYKKIR